MRREYGIRSISKKWVKRKYAFGAEGVPEGESDFLKVIYDFDGKSARASASLVTMFLTESNTF